MSLYFFDIHDGSQLASDDRGIMCETACDLSNYAVSSLPSMTKEMAPEAPSRTFWVKVRDESGSYLFRLGLSLTSAWLNDDAHRKANPSRSRLAATLERTRSQLSAIRRDLAEEGFSGAMFEIDSLLGVAETQAERQLTRV